MKRSPPLAALTGCGGGGGSDAKGDPGTPTSPASPSPTKTASPTQQVQQRILTGSDAAGYLVSKPHYGLATSQKNLTVAKSSCLPAGYAMNSLPVGPPQASLTRIAAKKEPDGILTHITLSAYAHGQAQAATTGLSTAVKSCADGSTAKGPGGKNPCKTARPSSSEPAATPRSRRLPSRLRTQSRPDRFF